MLAQLRLRQQLAVATSLFVRTRACRTRRNALESTIAGGTGRSAESVAFIEEFKRDVQRMFQYRDATIIDSEGLVAMKDTIIAAKDAHIAALNALISIKDDVIAANENVIAAQDATIAEKDADSKTGTLEDSRAGHDGSDPSTYVAALEKLIKAKGAVIAAMDDVLAAKNDTLAAKGAAIAKMR